jgi:UDP-N-acetyl-D-glucosamine/UDP-N-acetyl-D-galactosamine dehydrogenase
LLDFAAQTDPAHGVKGLNAPMAAFHRTPADARVGIVGLGYVGLPLAVEFGRKLPTVGFDINAARIEALRGGRDHTLEVSPEELAQSEKLRYSADSAELAQCNTYIVTVPTPIDEYKRPDLRPLESASRTVGRVLKRGDVVVYESTVYPGCTEEVCVPILERESGLTYNVDFFAGYSPERINPGDKQHRLPSIVKVVSGSTPAVAEYVDALYRTIVTAGTHRASSIAVAEAAKVIENTQRDVNIALINELALLFDRMGLDTEEVLTAAGTKWNFLPFRPGLVGGHCIGVDPYYLTYKAQQIGFHPEMILAGRRINDMMGHFVAQRVVKLMTRKRMQVVGSNILILGLAFKENCPDLRNTRVIDLVQEFRGYDANVEVHDPWVSADEARHEYGLELVADPQPGAYDAIVLAVAHRDFRDMAKIRALGKPGAVVFDVKGCLPRADVDGRL